MAVILLADDSWIARLKIGKVLRIAGYDVLEAVNGIEALETIETKQVDLLLLDLLMPEKTGTEVLREIKGKYQFPIIVLTADIQDSTNRECLSLGAKKVINKPPKNEELLELIHIYLEDKAVK